MNEYLEFVKTREPRRCGNPFCQQELDAIELQDPSFVIIDDKRIEVCGDCYFGAFGEEIEQHPIVTARVRRG